MSTDLSALIGRMRRAALEDASANGRAHIGRADCNEAASALEQQAAEIERRGDLVQALQDKLSSRNEEIFSLRTMYSQQAAEIARLRAELEACCTLKREYQEREVAAIAERDALRVERDELQADAGKWPQFREST